MNESVATITSSSTTTIKTLYMLHVTPFMLHLFRSSVSSPVHRVKDSMNEEIKKIYDKMDTSNSIKIQQLRKEEEEVSKKRRIEKVRREKICMFYFVKIEFLC